MYSAGEKSVTLEVADHLDMNSVRAIAMTPTGGLARGDVVHCNGETLRTPVGGGFVGQGA